MKINVTKPEIKFSPVAVTFTFETQRELNAFNAMFNCAPVCDTLRSFADHDVEYWRCFSGLCDNDQSNSPIRFLETLKQHPAMTYK
jgi:hypothetical protein